MFKKVLIANRGEIACRIASVARRLGVSSVAVYSEADRDAAHVEAADEALCIGAAPAAQSYLNMDAILAACRSTGAEAVHPGYGFLSERAAFAAAVEQAGLIFIGPNSRAIAAMGDKIESKRIAADAGASVVPGWLGAIEDVASAAAIAQEIGYPVMIKASAGGGGKGMRVARNRAELEEGLERARSEARSAFGDDRVFVEKYIDRPRHVEIQILADKHGGVIHLGERECSIQRRNQKIVEEAPSPLVDEEMRARMGEQAIGLARAVGYDSAGTAEFVVDQERRFYFLEMNARLQVEHPVTELVTRVDLVEQMFRIAAGERLAIRQSDVRLRGWAVETRICAEDPSRGFMPSIGRLSLYREPKPEAAGLILRVDSGVREGDEISIHYDSLLAKLVTQGGDRDEAIEAQSRALDSFAIDGVRTNLAFLSAIMRNPRWRRGRLSTRFVEEEFPQGFRSDAADDETWHAMAAVAAAADHLLNERKRQISGQTPTQRPVVFERARSVLMGSRRFDVRIEDAEGLLTVLFEDDSGHAHQVVGEWRPGEPIWRGALDGEPTAMRIAPALNGFDLSFRGACALAQVYSRREAELAALMRERPREARADALRCPMPGRLVAILVEEGQAVTAGQPLCVVEAMKMENVLRADADATIGDVLAQVGASLQLDAPILTFV